MLTHEKLLEKYQELQDAIDALEDAIHENGGIFNPDLKDHEYYMGNLIDAEESLLSIYLENRDSISDNDALVILTTITSSYFAEGYALGTEDSTPDGKSINIQWNKLK